MKGEIKRVELARNWVVLDLNCKREWKKLSNLLSKTQKSLKIAEITGAPKRIRIAVYSLKGCCPRPLDDGGTQVKYNRDSASRQRDIIEIIYQGRLRGAKPLFLISFPLSFEGEGEIGGEVDR